MTGGPWRFAVLGPLKVERDGQPVEVPGGHARTLLAVLLAADRPLSRERLIGELWGERPPASATSMLYVYVSKLRGSLGEMVELGPAGYALRKDGVELDVARFEALLESARRDPARAAKLLTDALDLFRGEPLCDVDAEGVVAEWKRALEDQRWQAVLARNDAELASGAGAELLSDLERHVRLQPLDERVVGQWMLALYRAGRQTDALEAYRRIRAQLAAELGLEPGPALQLRHQQILEHAPSLDGLDLAVKPAVAHRVEGSVHRLPSPTTPTIGREHELDDVVGLLERQDVRIVTLTGPGGVGKTRLALLAAHAVAGSSAAEAAWIELAAVPHHQEVATAIARGLGLTAAANETDAEALSRHLADQRLVLVLDNFEHVIESASLVAELHRSCPQLVVLVTSREPLDVSAEHCYAVPPLQLPDRDRPLSVEDVERTPSTAMFLAATRRRDHHFSLAASDVPALARICTRLEGLPLALELAAARTGAIDLGHLADELDARLDRLGTGPRDAPARQRTLEATIDWSFRLLDPELQTVFTRFSVFAGGATPEAAQAVVGEHSGGVEALIAKNMVVRRARPEGGTRLVMLETLRQYAERKLVDDAGEPELRRRHLDHYLTVLEGAIGQFATPDERLALEVLDREIENIKVAREWALSNEPNLCLRLTGHLCALSAIRPQKGALEWCEAALAAAGDDAPLADRARAEFRRSRLISFVWRFEEAIRVANIALELYRQAEDHAGIANTLRAIAADAGALGDLEQGREFAESALSHARESGDEVMLAKVIAEQANCAEGDDRGPLVEQAAEVLTRLGNSSGLIQLYLNCGYGALVEGRVQEANQLLDLALAVPPPADRLAFQRLLMSNVGLARLFAGDPRASVIAFAQALEIPLTGHSDDYGEIFAGLAAAAAVAGEDEVAARLHGAARTAGYPPSDYDRTLHERLIRDYVAAAQERLGPAFQSGEQAGEAWAAGEANTYALAWARTSAAEQSPRGGVSSTA